MPIKGTHLCGIKAASQLDWNDVSSCSYSIHERKHGRENTWQTSIFTDTLPQKGFELYPNLTTLFKIQRTDSRYENPTTIYYVSNRNIKCPILCLELVRKYWGIENDLHYNRDVIFKQDKNKIKTHNEAIIVAVFNTMAINIIRKTVGQNLTDAIDWAKNNKILFADRLRM